MQTMCFDQIYFRSLTWNFPHPSTTFPSQLHVCFVLNSPSPLSAACLHIGVGTATGTQDQIPEENYSLSCLQPYWQLPTARQLGKRGRTSWAHCLSRLEFCLASSCTSLVHTVTGAVCVVVCAEARSCLTNYTANAHHLSLLKNFFPFFQDDSWALKARGMI